MNGHFPVRQIQASTQTGQYRVTESSSNQRFLTLRGQQRSVDQSTWASHSGDHGLRRAARAHALSIPQWVLLRADAVIE